MAGIARGAAAGRRRLAAGGRLAAFVALACVGCNALWGISSLDVTGDAGGGDAGEAPPGQDGAARAPDAASDATTAGDAAADANLADAAPPGDAAPAPDYCQVHDADTGVVLCDDFDSYDGSMAALFAGGTWASSAFQMGPTEPLDLSTAAAAGADSAWALHEHTPADGGERSQVYLFDHVSSPTRIEIQLDLWMSSIPSHNDNDYVSFLGVGFEHGGDGTPADDIAVTIDDTGFSLGPGPLDSTVTLTPMTWTHVDWILVLNQVSASPTLSTSLTIDGATAVAMTDASNADAYGPATIQVGLTYEDGSKPSHDLYIDNVLVTAAP